MTYISDDRAPGCFGSALAFKNDAPACVSCVFSARCEPLHDANLVAMRLALGIVKKASVQASQKPTPSMAGVMLPSAKTQALVERIDKMSLKITEKLSAGCNPFAGANLPFMQVTCEILLRFKGAINQPLLAAAYVSKFAWHADTAEQHARMSIQALVQIGAVDLVEGIVKLRRN